MCHEMCHVFKMVAELLNRIDFIFGFESHCRHEKQESFIYKGFPFLSVNMRLRGFLDSVILSKIMELKP